MPKIDKLYLWQHPVPLPPLEVQKEIVSILDKFTQLEAELEAELEARRTQYEATRDRLLGFSSDTEPHPFFEFDNEPAVDKIGILQLTDVCEYSSDKVANINLLADQYVGVEQLLPNRMGRIKSMKVPSGQNLTVFKPGDVLLGNIRPYLKKIWFATEHGGCGGDVLVVSLKSTAQDLLIPRYLFHLLSSDRFFEYNVRHSKGAKMPRGSKKAIMEFQFGLPPKEIQARIVLILDKLDALVNDIENGLPAEIVARRKQYEYYRNKLLTFKELDAA